MNNTCVLTTEDKVRCWGYNGFGQLGTETTRDKGLGFPLVRGDSELRVDFVEFEGIF